MTIVVGDKIQVRARAMNEVREKTCEKEEGDDSQVSRPKASGRSNWPWLTCSANNVKLTKSLIPEQ